MSLRKNKNERQATGFRRFPKNQKTTKRVVDIILDENHPNYRAPQDIGIIFFDDDDLQ